MKAWSGLLLLLAVAGCAREAPEGALATLNGGVLTREDLDRRVLALPEAQRRPEDGDFQAWHSALLRQLAMDRILSEEAEDARFAESAEFLGEWPEVRCQTLAAALLRATEFDFEVSEDDRVAYFERHRDEFVEPARRQVSHLYLRRREQEKDADLEVRAEALRQRIEGGESFEAVARRFSDSESRHRGGDLGWIVAGRLGPKAEAVVFALAEGALSEPVMTVDGAHLFRVQQAVESRRYSLDEVRQTISQRLSATAAEAEIEELLADVRWPEDAFVPTSDELRTLLFSTDDKTLVLRLGDFALDLGEFRSRLQAATQRAGGGSASPLRLLEGLKRQRGLCRLAENNGLDEEVESIAALDRARQGLARRLFGRARLLNWIQGDEEALRRHFDENRARFLSPLRFRLVTLLVPLGRNPNARMAALEEARSALDRGEMTLDDLAQRWGGSTTESGWVDLAGLRAGEANVAEFASLLDAGEHSAPYLAATGLQMFRVEAREEPQEEEFDTVREQVVQHLLATHGERLYAEFSEVMLTAAEFEVLDDRVAQLQVKEPPSDP